MKREFLKGLGIEGLTDEIIDKIMGENGKDISKEQQKAEKSSQEIENLKSELKTTKETLDQANVQIKNFEGMDIEAKDKAIKEWETKYADLETNAKAEREANEKKLADQQYDFKINEIVGQHKFTDDFVRDSFKETLKKQEFKFGEDGTLQGANDYINKFKEDHKGIFVVEEAPSNEPPAPQFTNPTNNQQPLQSGGFNFGFRTLRPMPNENK